MRDKLRRIMRTCLSTIIPFRENHCAFRGQLRSEQEAVLASEEAKRCPRKATAQSGNQSCQYVTVYGSCVKNDKLLENSLQS